MTEAHPSPVLADDARPTSGRPRLRPTVAVVPGLALAVGLGTLATGLGTLVPVIGGPVIGIVLGVAVQGLLGPRPVLVRGSRFAATVVLQAAVVLLGAGLSIAQVIRTGWHALPVMVGTLSVALLGTALVGRWLGIDRETRTLIGVGTGICGASAIATVSAVIGASEVAIAYSMTTIFVFNVAAVLIFPVLGHALGLSQAGFGLWAGTAVNDTSSVVAAATVYGAAATSFAVVVKLTRTLMIIPISIALALGRHRRPRTALLSGGSPARLPWRRLVPAFLLLFLVAVAVNSLGIVPVHWHAAISWTARYFTAIALVGVGLGTPFGALRSAGWRPLALGAVLWVVVASSSLFLQWFTGSR